MSDLSSWFTGARQPLAPRPAPGRHARGVARAHARSMNGDFSAALADRPLDVTYRRLVRRALNAIRTRKARKQ